MWISRPTAAGWSRSGMLVRRGCGTLPRDVIWTARFTPDGKQLLTASRDRTAALWELETGRLVREFLHDQQVYDAALSPDGRRVVTGDASGLANVFASPSQSARGLAHSKTWRTFPQPRSSRSVLDCGSPLPLFPTCGVRRPLRYRP